MTNYLREWCIYLEYKKYRESTKRTYKSAVAWFLFQAARDVKHLSISEIREILMKTNAPSTLDSYITAVRQFYMHIFNRVLDWKQLPYPRPSYKIQPIYTPEEIRKILSVCDNLKHKAILMLMIDAALRISEPCGLLLNDYTEDSIIIRNGKGGKDRKLYLKETTIHIIREYIKIYKPDKYLFDGQHTGESYSVSSIRQLLKTYCVIAGVLYKSPHAIRRLAATYAVEHGASETSVSKKLGHNSVKTLQKYYLIHSPEYQRSIPTVV